MTDRGYGRISLDTERSGSKVKQRSRVAEEAKGEWEWYFDESVSGSKIPFDQRPDGARLLADLEKGDRVLMTKIDRAARSVSDLLELVKLIDAKGATIKFVDQPFLDTDPSNPFARFILTLLAAIAELEAGIIGERRRESLQSFAAEGRHAVGAAPFGFHSVPNPKGRGLVIRTHPENGPRLKAQLDLIAAGKTTQEKAAAELGMTKPGFNRLIRNPRLAGMTPQNGGVLMVNGSPRIDPEAALLTMQEWSRLQSKLKQGHKWNKHEGIGPALVCETCGGRLYISKAGNRQWDKDNYKCNRQAPEHKEQKLPGAAVTVDMVEEHIEKAFLTRFGDLPHMIAEWQDSEDERTYAISLAQITLDEVRRRLDEAETDEEEDALVEEERAARKALRAAKALPITRQQIIIPTGMTVGERWKEADAAERVLLLRAHGQWIVRPGRMRIEEKVVLREPKIDMDKIIAGLTPLS